MAGFPLDTNHVSEAIRPVSRVRERIEQSRRERLRVGTCIPALCDLLMLNADSPRKAPRGNDTDVEDSAP
jgi:predicted nucleic acid-binding protein